MSFKDHTKKLAFTLAEVVIALFIIAILAMLTLPVINRQLDKTDEYAYYMAFKTVEKMASQVVLLGEPYNDDTTHAPEGVKIAKANLMNDISLKVKVFFRDISNKIAYTEKTFMKKLFPKTFAQDCPAGYVCSLTTNTDIFSTDDFVNQIWAGYRVCNGGQVLLKKVADGTNSDGTTRYKEVYYTDKYFNECYGYTKNCTSSVFPCGHYYNIDDYGNITSSGDKRYGPIFVNDFLLRRLPSYMAFENINSESDLRNFISGTLLNSIGYNNSKPDNGEALCNAIANKIKTIQDENGTKIISSVRFESEESRNGGNNDDDDDSEVSDLNDLTSGLTGGYCVYSSYRQTEMGTNTGSSETKTERTPFTDAECQNGKNGYWHMINAGKPETIECVPDSGYVESENNPKYACPISAILGGKRCYAYIPEGKTNYTDTSYVGCVGDFSETQKGCCPENSFALGGVCQCASGYKLLNNKCVLDTCQDGYSPHTVDGKLVCVLNPPIIQAKRFCELVADHWNIKKNFCNAITYTAVPDLTGAKYNKEVYDAAMGQTSGRFLSIDSKPGAFSYDANADSGLKPNLILANGLYMWILGDRSASIPGLTFTTENPSPSTNVCKNMNKETKVECDKLPNSFFCASENACYSITEASKTIMGDARNCCTAPNLSDISAAYAAGTGATSQDAYFQDPRVYAISGFTVFVDINGSRGSGTLWEDVFPFYVGSNGMVYPGYPLDAVRTKYTDTSSHTNVLLGGNSVEQLPTDVYYYDVDDNGNRVKKVAFPNVSYARALCSARKISKNSPYCLNLGLNFHEKVKFKRVDDENFEAELNGTDYLGNDNTTPGGTLSTNPCDFEACFISVKRKLRSF